MRIENTDRFRNKWCGVHFKNGGYNEGKVIYIPNMSAKYNFHPVGWFLVKEGFGDLKLNFKDIVDIEVGEFPYCSHCDRITDPGCVENCDVFKTLKEKED